MRHMLTGEPKLSIHQKGRRGEMGGSALLQKGRGCAAVQNVRDDGKS